jgi:hypothetical protein
MGDGALGDAAPGDAATRIDAESCTEEVCNQLDDDCDDEVDEGLPTQTYYVDSDGDGFGNGDSPMEACGIPEDAAAEAGDCDDNDGEIHPDAPEQCNEVDDDCDGALDEELLQPEGDVRTFGPGANWFRSIAATPGGFLIAWQDSDGRARFQRIDPFGEPLEDSRLLDPMNPEQDEEFPSATVVTPGSAPLGVYLWQRDRGSVQVRSGALGRELDDSPVEVRDPHRGVETEDPPLIYRSREQTVALWTNGNRILVAEIDARGPSIERTGFLYVYEATDHDEPWGRVIPGDPPFLLIGFVDERLRDTLPSAYVGVAKLGGPEIDSARPVRVDTPAEMSAKIALPVALRDREGDSFQAAVAVYSENSAESDLRIVGIEYDVDEGLSVADTPHTVSPAGIPTDAIAAPNGADVVYREGREQDEYQLRYLELDSEGAPLVNRPIAMESRKPTLGSLARNSSGNVGLLFPDVSDLQAEVVFQRLSCDDS